MKPNLLFLNPPYPIAIYRGIMCCQISKAKYCWQPHDFMLISSIIRDYTNCSFLDATNNTYDEEYIKNYLLKNKIDILFCAVGAISFENDFTFLASIKKNFPGLKIYVIGDICFDKKLTNKILGLTDAIIVNPLSLELLNLITGQEISSPTIIKEPRVENEVFRVNTLNNLPTINPPIHELFISKKYRSPFIKRKKYTTILTQYGCPFGCSYCPSSKVAVTQKNLATIDNEFNYVKSLGLKEIYIGDQTFGLPREITDKILDLLISKYDFSWHCYSHPLLASDETFVSKLKQAGCHTVIMGIDSVNPKILKAYGRFHDLEKIKQAVKNLQRYKIKICGDFIIGLENETVADIKNTIDYACSSGIEYGSFNIASPVMASSFRDKEGASELPTTCDTTGSKTVVQLGQIPVEELVKLRNYAVKKFYLRPSYLIKSLLNVRSFEEFFIKSSEAFFLIKKSLFGNHD